eukprot:CAMPEP_0198604376 /NCGR_PEP_ID=MMETSP1462-20131121/153121_1 /TAXON_ID=1333877 /ORGANISM="Brandtodinium nutriculum, Strain RCC3387" /LENGTH=58 /DNA_ID=CAMNT_0044336163 /DNA_START=50 /DNA_END=222 /DNA_ORIENTATION=-
MDSAGKPPTMPPPPSLAALPSVRASCVTQQSISDAPQFDMGTSSAARQSVGPTQLGPL